MSTRSDAQKQTLDEERCKREALLPPNARCEKCWESDALVLIASDVRRILCADCDAIAHGLPAFEIHHIAGKANGPWTVTVTCNMHRRLTVRQRLRAAQKARP